MMKKKKNEEIWIHTQNPRRFPGCTVVVVVVVTLFVKILDDFHDFVSECVSFPWENQQPFWEVTHFSDENRRKKIAKVSPSNNNYSFRIL